MTRDEIMSDDITRVLDCGRVIDLSSVEVVLSNLFHGLLTAKCSLDIAGKRLSFLVVVECYGTSVPVRLFSAHWFPEDDPFMDLDAFHIACAIEPELTALIDLKWRAAHEGAQ